MSSYPTPNWCGEWEAGQKWQFHSPIPAINNANFCSCSACLSASLPQLLAVSVTAHWRHQTSFHATLSIPRVRTADIPPDAILFPFRWELAESALINSSQSKVCGPSLSGDYKVRLQWQKYGTWRSNDGALNSVACFIKRLFERPSFGLAAKRKPKVPARVWWAL